MHCHLRQAVRRDAIGTCQNFEAHNLAPKLTSAHLMLTEKNQGVKGLAQYEEYSVQRVKPL